MEGSRNPPAPALHVGFRAPPVSLARPIEVRHAINLLSQPGLYILFRHFGALAQLVARFHGMEEVRGSNPLCSTMSKHGRACLVRVLTFQRQSDSNPERAGTARKRDSVFRCQREESKIPSVTRFSQKIVESPMLHQHKRSQGNGKLDLRAFSHVLK